MAILHSLAHRGGHRRLVVAFSLRCRTAVACSRGRIRRSLRTPVRHAASAQMVGVDRATARSAAVRPDAARGTVCGHGVRGRVLGSVVPAVAMAGSSGRAVSSLGGCHVTLLVFDNIDWRHFAWVVATLAPKGYRFSKTENGPQNGNGNTHTMCSCSVALCLLPTYFLFSKI